MAMVFLCQIDIVISGFDYILYYVRVYYKVVLLYIVSVCQQLHQPVANACQVKAYIHAAKPPKLSCVRLH